MLFWRRGRVRVRRGFGCLFGGALPTTWCRLRSLFLIVFRRRRTGRLTAGRCLRRRVVLGRADGAPVPGGGCVRAVCRGIGFGACWDRRRLFCAWWSFAACDASDQPRAFEP